MQRVRVWMAVASLLVATMTVRAGEPAPAVLADDVQALKSQLATQQEQIRQLQDLLRRQGALLEALQRQMTPLTGQVGALPPAGPAGDAVADASQSQETPVAAKVDALAEQTAEVKSQVGSLLKKVESFGNFRFSGDLRVRYEPFFQEGTEQRHRDRARLRFRATAKLSDELTGGFGLVTGALEDPHSTNQSFTGFFTHKPILLDQFWLAYQPTQAAWLKVTGGKFPYTWYRTELTFDNDLQPEGFSQQFSFDLKDSPLTNFSLVLFELPFNEVGSGNDSFILGGQVQSRWKISEKTKFGLYMAGLNFRNADAIAQAIGAGTLRPSQALSNSVRTGAGGAIVAYSNKFAYFDIIAELNHELTPRWPLRLTLDFVNNVRGPRERSAYWAELAIGRSAEKGDWLFGYTFIRTEKDAVLGAYSYSDTRAATNVLNHRFQMTYRVHRSVSLEYMLFLGRLFNPADNLNLVPASFRPLARDPYMSRMQFDAIYKF